MWLQRLELENLAGRSCFLFPVRCLKHPEELCGIVAYVWHDNGNDSDDALQGK